MNYKYLLSFGGLITFGIVLLLLPPDFFDQGESICPSVHFFGVECPGCGMTRAIMHLVHFDVEAAWQYNKLSFVLLPVLAYFYVVFVLKTYRRIRRQDQAGKSLQAGK